MTDDDIVKSIGIGLMLAHGGALMAATALRKGIIPVLVLNLLLSAGVVIYWAPRFSELFHYVDAVLAFVAFELVVLASSILALRGFRVPHLVIWVEFAAHAILNAAALLFMFTFKMMRMM
ncbi:MAG: hypothetical protein ACHQAY_09710 [Hyphomicrobiales bacterium]